MKAEYGDGAFLTSWFVGFGTMQHDPDSLQGLSHKRGYIISEDSPHSAYGVGQLSISDFHGDLSDGEEDLFDEDE